MVKGENMGNFKPEDRIILALDVDGIEEVKKIVGKLRGKVGLFKVGIRLFFHYGPSVVELIKKAGGKVFLDVKLYDIPSVVESTAKIIGKMKVDMLTLHTLGGVEMMRRACSALKKESPDVKLIGVTLLTSYDEKTLKDDLGMEESIEEKVLFLAGKAKEAGLDGVVCSGREVRILKDTFGNNFILVVPGIRMGKVEKDEQKRVLTPEDAISRGADYLVIGRPILKAPDKMAAVNEIIKRITPFSGGLR